MVTALWHALPPEINTARLLTGAGPTPMSDAAAGWAALAAALDAQADELSAHLHAIGEMWTGAGSERAVAAVLPMVIWLQTTAAQARRRGEQTTAQVAAYMRALDATPSLPEIAANRITHAALTAANFLGINAVPIAAKEVDYFVRLWNQAAAAMDVYQAETLTNTRFDQIEAMTPIVSAGAGRAGTADLSGELSALTSTVAVPKGRLPIAETVTQLLARGGPALHQLVAELEPLTSSFNHSGDVVGGSLVDDVGRPGLLGVGPLSNHPLAGGSGPRVGAGLIRGDSLPGAGGSVARTSPLVALVDGPVPAGLAPAAANAESSGTGGAALAAVIGAGAQTGHSSKPALICAQRSTDEFEEGTSEIGEHHEDW